MPFSVKMLEFLFENRMRNDKAWFESNRATYREYVYEPLAEFVSALEPTMHAIDENIVCIPRVSKSISRIYRDTRFSKDKSLYRDVMWCTFMRSKNGQRGLFHGLPGYFFEISQSGFRYGAGYYEASTASMRAFRELILAADKSFIAAKTAFDAQSIFGLEGEEFKRIHYPDAPIDTRAWLNKKNIDFIYNSTDFNTLFSADLPTKVAHDFKLLEPMYHFLLEAESRIETDGKISTIG